MNVNFRPYDGMKDSGVEWLGRVPQHWEVAMAKRHYSIQLGKMLQTTPNRDDDVEVPYLRARHVQWFSVDLSDPPLMWANTRELDQFGVISGDLLVCEGGEGGRCGTVRQDIGRCIIQNALHRVRPRRQNRSDFLQYVLRSIAAHGWFDALNDKATIAHFTREKLGSLRIPRPIRAEQTAIVRFLDEADRRIRRYIRSKQKLVTLLKEEKQAITHQAVTGKIDVRTGVPYPAYKASGVEWLGDVPDRWEVVPLRRVTLGCCDGPFGSGLKSSHYTEKGVRVVRLQNIGHGEFKDSGAAFISPEHYSSLGDHSVVPGDVLIAGLGDNNHPSGRACVAPTGIIPAMVKADCFRFRLNQDQIQPRFAVLQLTATASVASAVLSTGATRQRTNLLATSGRAIGIPSVPEQNFIVEHLNAELSGTRRAQVAVQKEIGFLLEYRTRLIADVATGKLDVREAVAQLAADDYQDGAENPDDDHAVDQEVMV